MKHSEGDLGPLFTALIKAQKLMDPLLKESGAEIDGRDYKYNKLDAVQAASLPHLNANGLGVVQFVNGQGCETVLCHESGAWISGENNMSDDPQRDGKCQTYARKGALAGLAQIPQADNDAQGTKRKARKGKSNPLQSRTPVDSPAPAEASPEGRLKEAVGTAKEVFEGATEAPKPTVPKTREDVVIVSGRNKGKPLSEWSTDYAIKAQQKLSKMKLDDKGLPPHLDATLVLIELELKERLEKEAQTVGGKVVENG